MFRNFIVKLQQLQLLALEYGVNMEFGICGSNTDDPWVPGKVTVEGCDYFNDEEGTTYIFFYWHPYKWRSEEENQMEFDTEIARIENFINEHKNK